ncbi:MAG: hypothetical protein K8S97_17225, partial [Anaerolineae bacterium]|nr:hypothetical protein [Anaerolineae bacterium]
RAQCAWAYYLAGQMDNARRIVKKVQWPEKQSETELDLIIDIQRVRYAQDFKTYISHPLLLLAVFMQAKLLGYSVARAQGVYDVYYYALESEMLKFANTPLGRDMRPMLDDMRQVFAPPHLSTTWLGGTQPPPRDQR